MTDLHHLLVTAAEHAADYRASLAQARVFPDASVDEVRRGFHVPLPDGPQPAAEVVEALGDAARPGLVATAGPRYFGFVVGGALDAATAAEVLAAGWDQVAFNAMSSPAAAAAEEAVGVWLKDLLRLPTGASFGLVSGGQGANTVALAAARHHVLREARWNVERDGLIGGPPVRVVASVERHATIDRALRLLGFGAAIVEPVQAGAQGAIDVDELRAVLDRGATAPTIVCLQAGNVNSGAFDDLDAAIDVAHRHGAWVHVDGAFGLWAAAADSTRALVSGLEGADSWATDGHKWLNVPYDSGYAFCAHPESHAAAMALTAAYHVPGEASMRSPSDLVTESSRRARGFATWAALRELGRSGVADLVERCCALARRFAGALDAADGVEVVNDVVLNQVLVRFGDDARTDRVIADVQRSGVCWMGGTTWHGMRLMRISVSSWATTEADVDRSVAAVLAANGAA
jgi:glutamate/tyrosine decarboxylase-like PLP-dependent enzyme